MKSTEAEVEQPLRINSLNRILFQLGFYDIHSLQSSHSEQKFAIPGVNLQSVSDSGTQSKPQTENSNIPNPSSNLKHIPDVQMVSGGWGCTSVILDNQLYVVQGKNPVGISVGEVEQAQLQNNTIVIKQKEAIKLVYLNEVIPNDPTTNPNTTIMARASPRARTLVTGPGVKSMALGLDYLLVLTTNGNVWQAQLSQAISVSDDVQHAAQSTGPLANQNSAPAGPTTSTERLPQAVHDCGCASQVVACGPLGHSLHQEQEGALVANRGDLSIACDAVTGLQSAEGVASTSKQCDGVHKEQQPGEQEDALVFNRQHCSQVKLVFEAQGAERAVQVAAAYKHSLLLTDTGAAYAWGWNGYCQCGISSKEKQSVEQPTKLRNIPAFFKIKHVAVGQMHSAAVTDCGDVICWGGNDNWQLGDSSASNFGSTPVVLSEQDLFGQEASKVYCGAKHTVVLSTSNQAITWGWNKYGQVNGKQDGAVKQIPTLFNQHRFITGVGCGRWHTAILSKRESC